MARPISPNGSVDAAEVRGATFRLIRRGGYDPQQVDPFLEILAQTLEGGPHGDARIDGNYVHGVRFTTVRRGGYLPSQVDAFLDRVIDTFDERNTAPTSLDSNGALPGDQPTNFVPEIQLDAVQPGTGTTETVNLTTPAPAVDDAEASAQVRTTLSTTLSATLEPPLDSTNEADFERLQILHTSGVLSDKEFVVLGARVRRRIATDHAKAAVAT